MRHQLLYIFPVALTLVLLPMSRLHAQQSPPLPVKTPPSIDVLGNDVMLPLPVAGGWLALQSLHGKSALIPAVPDANTLSTNRTDTLEISPGMFYGRGVTTDIENPVIVLRSALFSAGPVVQAAIKGASPRQVLKLHRETYVFEKACSRQHRAECKVLLRHRSRVQCLAYATLSNDEFSADVSLVWAGDLDRDGKLDVILSVGSGRGEEDLAVYLSSLTKPGQLVLPAAGYLPSDCELNNR
ncbi:hypothetical protein [Pseudoduganella ginsengisoli]|uniref:Uncharacterized protein n=1 Tax=Pseudoduganella ginsengisoli TaxID=1462440 RepID=A0A6L6PXG2_9BURK|nr:hypothetical protein [Pseudoduganella ginsengisoli]MTW01926.1 hypothetical protein [Pseudoduganella ginsengisoli]